MQSLASAFQELLLVLKKFSFWQEDWTLGYHFMRVSDFRDIS